MRSRTVNILSCCAGRRLSRSFDGAALGLESRYYLSDAGHVRSSAPVIQSLVAFDPASACRQTSSRRMRQFRRRLRRSALHVWPGPVQTALVSTAYFDSAVFPLAFEWWRDHQIPSQAWQYLAQPHSYLRSQSTMWRGDSPVVQSADNKRHEDAD